MKKILKGSYTVEATLIMPLVLGVIFLIMNLSFYMYDYSVIEQYTSRAAQKYLLDMEHSPKEIKSLILSEDNKINSLLIAKDVSVQAEVTQKEISVMCSATLNKPLAEHISFWNKRNDSTINIKREVRRTKPVEFIRKCRKISN